MTPETKSIGGPPCPIGGGIWVNRDLRWFADSSGMLADNVTIFGTSFRRVTSGMIEAMRHSGADETLVSEIEQALDYSAEG